MEQEKISDFYARAFTLDQNRELQLQELQAYARRQGRGIIKACQGTQRCKDPDALGWTADARGSPQEVRLNACVGLATSSVSPWWTA